MDSGERATSHDAIGSGDDQNGPASERVQPYLGSGQAASAAARCANASLATSPGYSGGSGLAVVMMTDQAGPPVLGAEQRGDPLEIIQATDVAALVGVE
jgi:hypothetical protein